MADFPAELAKYLTKVEPVDPARQGNQAILRRAVWVDENRTIQVIVKQMYRARDARPLIWKFWRASQSPFIARLIYADQLDGIDYEVTEYQEAGSLHEYLFAHAAPMPVKVAKSVLGQLSMGLKYLHDNQVLHGDLKPANILVKERSPLQLLIIDFGIATQLEGGTVENEAWAGSDKYVAPERRSGRQRTMRSDWWSVGIIMLELLLGTYPFPQPEDVDEYDIYLADRFREADIDIRPLVEGLSDVDERWVNLLEGLLTREYKDRWTSLEVFQWLDDTKKDPRVRRTQQSFDFDGERLDSPVQLANALRRKWGAAGALIASRTIVDLADWVSSGESRWHLRQGTAGDILELSSQRPDLAVTKLIKMLDNSAEAVATFRNKRLDGSFPNHTKAHRRCYWLDQLALTALRPAEDPQAVAEQQEARQTLASLWASEALNHMAGPAGGALAEVDEDWRSLYSAAHRALDLIPPEARPEVDDQELILRLLRIAANPTYVGKIVDATVTKSSWRLHHAKSAWMRELLDRAIPHDRPEYRTFAGAYHVVLFLCGRNAADEPVRVTEEALAEARARLSGSSGELDRVIYLSRMAEQPVPGLVTRAGRKLWRAGVTLTLMGVYTLLCLGVGVGVALGGMPYQGMLLSAFLLFFGIWVWLAYQVRQRKAAKTLLGGVAGGLVGLPLAASAGLATALSVNQPLGWLVFWAGWASIIILTAAWGAIE